MKQRFCDLYDIYNHPKILVKASWDNNSLYQTSILLVIKELCLVIQVVILIGLIMI